MLIDNITPVVTVVYYSVSWQSKYIKRKIFLKFIIYPEVNYNNTSVIIMVSSANWQSHYKEIPKFTVISEPSYY